MFLQFSAENKTEKTESAIKELTIQMEALQKEFNEFVKVVEAHSDLPESALYVSEINGESTAKDLKLLEELLQKHTNKLERAKKNTLAEAKKKQTDRNVPAHWLFVR